MALSELGFRVAVVFTELCEEFIVKTKFTTLEIKRISSSRLKRLAQGNVPRFPMRLL